MSSKVKVSLHATCHQLPAAHYHQVSEGEGSSLSVAIGRAVDALLAKPHVKGKRHSQIDFKVYVESSKSGNSEDS